MVSRPKGISCMVASAGASRLPPRIRSRFSVEVWQTVSASVAVLDTMTSVSVAAGISVRDRLLVALP